VDRLGRLAQLVERLLYTQDVGGSSPSLPTSLCTFGATARQASECEGCSAGAAKQRRRAHGQSLRNRLNAKRQAKSLSLQARRYFPEGPAKDRQTDSFNSLEARKATFLLALIWIASPVAGLRPMRAARLRT
jgi:hypothetical protein